MRCPTCSLPLVRSLRALAPASHQSVMFCPKCRAEVHGEVVEGVAVEVEPIFYLLVPLPERISVQQVQALRLVSKELAEQTASQALATIRAKRQLDIGPFYLKAEMDNAQACLRRSGLASIPRF
ncbi:hypothetical protein AAW51_0365 [Caldimonas brevitalea]|uniref:Uncharacterized protein n=1 Tax=Caldimonas brevitalea TaxID=413882 RepID=A0A0G3BI64_9BURK|nr:hypothetical protein AAW51_0365 [Caldimonas brevitalea]